MKKTCIFIAVLLSMVFVNVWQVSANDEGVEMYRMYNPNAGDHHYTLNANERDFLIRAGWRYEGIRWNAIEIGKPASHTSSTSYGGNNSDTISDGSLYPNCDAARRAGVTPIYRGQPVYSHKLDKDGDGIACE